MKINIEKPDRNVRLTSDKYMMFGEVSAKLQGVAAKGVITTFELFSDSGNRIGWVRIIFLLYDGCNQDRADRKVEQRLSGGRPKEATSFLVYQNNVRGDERNSSYAFADGNTASDEHKFGIKWTESQILLSVDDKSVNHLQIGEVPPPEWPQTPMRVRIVVHAVEGDSGASEIALAGGLPEWKDNESFTAHYGDLNINDYMAGCKKASKEGVKYVWPQDTTDWEDVKVLGCADGRNNGYIPDGPMDSATAVVEPTGRASLDVWSIGIDSSAKGVQTDGSDVTFPAASSHTSTTTSSEIWHHETGGTTTTKSIGEKQSESSAQIGSTKAKESATHTGDGGASEDSASDFRMPYSVIISFLLGLLVGI